MIIMGIWMCDGCGLMPLRDEYELMPLCDEYGLML